MDFSKNLFFARKNKLTIAIKSFILQCGNTHYQDGLLNLPIF